MTKIRALTIGIIMLAVFAAVSGFETDYLKEHAANHHHL